MANNITVLDYAGNQVTLSYLDPGSEVLIGQVQLYDGNNAATIKAASTAPVAGDPALVVTVSPNSPKGTGALAMQGASPSGATQLGYPVQAGGVYTSAPTLSSGQGNALLLDSAGNLCANLKTAIPAGTNLLGKITPNDGTNSITVKAASTAAALTDTAQVVALSPNCPLSKPTAGSPIRVSAKTLIKGSAGVLFGLSCINSTGSAIFVQIFDAATTGAVTLATTEPDFEMQVPANGEQFATIPPQGIPFVNGIVYAATTLEFGSVAVTTGDAVVFPVYA